MREIAIITERYDVICNEVIIDYLDVPVEDYLSETLISE
jgi:hypothetical protein